MRMDETMKPQNRSLESVPRPFLIAAGALVALTLILIAGVRLTGLGASTVPVGEAVAVTDLRFKDQPDGSIAVYSGPEERLIETVQPGTNGFLRGTLRALVRERRQKSIDDSVPFRLVRDTNNSLLLTDPATGRRIYLGAFGPANAGVFASLLASGSKPQ